MSAPASRSPWIARIVATLALVVGLGVALTVRSSGGIDLDPESLRARIESLGWLAPAGFVTAAALRPFLLLPSWVVMSAGGLLFGVLGGIVWGSLGCTLGALVTFGMARGLGREVVAKRMHGRLARLDAYLRRRGAAWLGLYTALPVSALTPVHAAAGLSGVSTLAFAVAVALGFVPRTTLYSVFGDSLARGDSARIIVVAAVGVVVLAIGIAVARRIGRSVEAEPEPDAPES